MLGQFASLRQVPRPRIVALGMVNLVAATGSVRFTGRWAETKAALFDPLSVLIGLLPRNRWKRLAVLAAMAQGVRGERAPAKAASRLTGLD
eukprot:COSAG01_NODE_38444_length_489_cov_1.351282_1_plen_90_part_01